MQTGSKTIVGVFSDLADAQSAAAELRSLGNSSVRLVENDQDSSYSKPAESEYRSTVEPRETGISGFFSRLFGFDDDRVSRNLNSDSEAYFQDTYNNKHHLVIVENYSDASRCREIINAQGGTIEEQGREFYERELYRDQDILNSKRDSSSDSEKVMELREEQLEVTSERVQTGEVSLRKEIITETRTIEVPLTREEIVVERRPVQGAARDGSLDASDRGDTEEIRIPVSEEYVHVEKKVVPREEVRISKEEITDTEVVSEDVLREEARVEAEGRVAIKDRTDRKSPPNPPANQTGV